MRLLLVAPTCDGEDIGEAWVAFQWASRLSQRYDLTLLTYNKRDRTPVSRQLPDVHVVEWLEPAGLNRAERLNSMLKPGYIPFFYRARRWIREAQSQGAGYTVGHQPTPVAMRYPSPFVGGDIPYVMGPVGGSLDDPPGFESDGDTAPWYVGLRRFDDWRLHHDRLLRRSYEEAACVLGIADYTLENLTGIPLRRFEVMSETAMPSLPPEPSHAPHNGPLRLLFVGRVIRTKGLRDAIRALALIPGLDFTFDVIGDGFDLAECRSLAAASGLGTRINFHGRMDRSAIDEYYRNADIFVFPSYREPGGNVVFEAMAFGLPLIVADRGGPGNATDDSCAIRITPTSPPAFAQAIAAAIVTLNDDPDLRRQMGSAARRLAERTALWDNRVDSVSKLYAEIERRDG